MCLALVEEIVVASEGALLIGLLQVFKEKFTYRNRMFKVDTLQ